MFATRCIALLGAAFFVSCCGLPPLTLIEDQSIKIAHLLKSGLTDCSPLNVSNAQDLAVTRSNRYEPRYFHHKLCDFIHSD